MKGKLLYLGCCLLGLLSVSSNSSPKTQYSPYVDRSYPTDVYWGDTHLHTSQSFDAYTFGTRKLGPEEAYRFAKGEVMTSSINGMQVRIRRPLDFLVVSDHAASMGVMNGLERQDPDLLASEVGKRWAPKLKAINEAAKIDSAKAKELSIQLFREGLSEGPVEEDEYRETVWKNIVSMADKHNDPGKFTALIGYEWTAVFLMQHRVVIFKDGAEKVGQVIPFSQYDSLDPEDLWAYLKGYEQKTGGEVLAIPHSGDGSGGTMFALQNAKGVPFTKLYAKTRSRWEPLYEVTQMMGDSESHPVKPGSDESPLFTAL